jgi:branched-chain amino acid transport system permease protein
MARALGPSRALAGGALGLILVLPLLLEGSYALHLLVLSALWSILALSFNVVAGYRGLLSLVHVAFFAVGAYVSGLSTLRLGLSFWLALPLAGVAAVAGALAVGWVILRLPVHAFIIASVAVAVIVNLALLNWVEVTNGPMGLAGVMPPRLAVGGLDVDFADRTAYYYLVVAVLVAYLGLERRFVRSRFGRAALALRENPVLAVAHGLDPLRHGLIAFGLGALGAGLAGSLYAHYMSVVSPELATFVYMTLLVVMVVVGGRATLAGPLLGAALFIVLPEYLRLTKAYRDSAIGLTLMLTVRFLPEGIVGAARDAWRRLARAGGPRWAGGETRADHVAPGSPKSH